ncbi:MAG: phospholipase D-like domain-containing protein, partial [Saezia sp.]
RDLLTEKAQQGVKVRVLLDWLGSRRISHHYMADFLKAGGGLDFFHKGGLPQLQSLVNMRLHRKIVVCDGCVGFTGGVNISDIQDARKTEYANHDLHIKVEGPVAYWLDEVFLEDWYYTTGEIPNDIPAPVPLESVPLNKMQQVQVIAAGPDTPDAPLWRAKLIAINAAKQRVWLVTPYFVPDSPAVYALTTAALKGLDVRLMLPRKSDHLITDLAARSWFKGLMKAGVKIWLYNEERMIHAKSLLVDECYSFVGSDNFDNRSFRLNFEVAILNYERSGAIALANQFEKDMQNAQRLELHDLNVKWWRCLPEDVARLASPLL